MGKGIGSSWCDFFSVHYSILLLFMNATCCFSFVQTQTPCHDNERSALLQFKASFSIDKSASQDPFAYPKVASWGRLEVDPQRSNCCLWDGVECSNDSGHVVGLDLASSYLHGSINSSSSLFQLVHLQSLDLSDNNFSFSQVPARLGLELTSLTYLNLSMSSFSGQIPTEISYLSKLSALDLSTTFESHLKMANFESLVQNLTKIKQLHLGWVELGSRVPNTLVNASSLTSLVLRACNMTGHFPVGIFHLPNLQVLDLYYNEYLYGYLPDTFNKSSPLKILNIFNTYFSGHLPASIGDLRALTVLNIAYCMFHPHVPSSLANLTQLSFLDLSLFHGSRTFSGHVTDSWSWVGKLTKLNSLSLRSNNLRGDFPGFLASLTQLEELDLSENQLTGEIPCSLASMAHLSKLYLLMNQITGELPSCLANLTQLSEIHLGYNKITGQIPSYLGQFTQLTTLEIPSNNLQGAIPRSLFNLRNLEYIYLDSNNLSGFVELEEFSKLEKLRVLDLSTLEMHSVSSNEYEGEIPGIIGNLRGLRLLNLSNNNLTGPIRSFLGNLTVLESLDLSQNQLSGKIPSDLAQLAFLAHFNVSNNRLYGPIPQGGQFNRFRQDSYQGNPGLCGKPLSKMC